MTHTLITIPIIPQSALLFNPVCEKTGATLSRVAPVYNTVKSKLDLIGEITVDTRNNMIS